MSTAGHHQPYDAALESPLVSRRLVVRRKKEMEKPQGKAAGGTLHRTMSRSQGLSGRPLYSIREAIAKSGKKAAAARDEFHGNPSPLSSSPRRLQRTSSLLSLSSHDMLSDHPAMQEVLSPRTQPTLDLHPHPLTQVRKHSQVEIIVGKEEREEEEEEEEEGESKVEALSLVDEAVQTVQAAIPKKAVSASIGCSPSDPVDAWLSVVTKKHSQALGTFVTSQGTNSSDASEPPPKKDTRRSSVINSTASSPPLAVLREPSTRSARLGTPPTARRLFSADLRLSGSAWDTTPHAAKFPSVPSSRSPSPRDSELAVTRHKIFDLMKMSPSPRRPAYYEERRSTSYHDMVREMSSASRSSGRELSVNEASRVALVSAEASTRRTLEWAEGLARCHIADATDEARHMLNARRSKAVLASQLADEEAVHRLQLLLAGQNMPDGLPASESQAARVSTRSDIAAVGMELLTDHQSSFRERLAEEESAAAGTLQQVMVVEGESCGRGVVVTKEWGARCEHVMQLYMLGRALVVGEEAFECLAVQEYKGRHHVAAIYLAGLTRWHLDHTWIESHERVLRSEAARRGRLMCLALEDRERCTRAVLQQWHVLYVVSMLEARERGAVIAEQATGIAVLRAMRECLKQEAMRRVEVVRSEQRIYESIAVTAGRGRLVAGNVSIRIEENETRSNIQAGESVVRNDMQLQCSLSLSEVLFRDAVGDEEAASRAYLLSMYGVMGTSIVQSLESSARVNIQIEEVEAWSAIRRMKMPLRSPPVPPSEAHVVREASFTQTEMHTVRTVTPITRRGVHHTVLTETPGPVVRSEAHTSSQEVAQLPRGETHIVPPPALSDTPSSKGSHSMSHLDLSETFIHNISDLSHCYPHDTTLPQGAALSVTSSPAKFDTEMLQDLDDSVQDLDEVLGELDAEVLQDLDSSLLSSTTEAVSRHTTSHEHSASTDDGIPAVEVRIDTTVTDADTTGRSHDVYNASYDEIVRTVNLMCDSSEDGIRGWDEGAEVPAHEVTEIIQQTIREIEGSEWMTEASSRGRRSGSSGTTITSASMRCTDYEWDTKRARVGSRSQSGATSRSRSRASQQSGNAVSQQSGYAVSQQSGYTVSRQSAHTTSQHRKASYPAFKRRTTYGDEFKRRNENEKWNKIVGANAPSACKEKEKSIPGQMHALAGWMEREGREEVAKAEAAVWKGMLLKFLAEVREINQVVKGLEDVTPTIAVEIQKEKPQVVRTEYYEKYEVWKRQKENSKEVDLDVISPVKRSKRRRRVELRDTSSDERSSVPVEKPQKKMQRDKGNTFDSVGMGVFIGSEAALTWLRKLEDDEHETRKELISRERAIASQLASTSAALNKRTNEHIIKKIAEITRPEKLQKPTPQKPPPPPPPPTFWGHAATTRKRYLKY